MFMYRDGSILAGVILFFVLCVSLHILLTYRVAAYWYLGLLKQLCRVTSSSKSTVALLKKHTLKEAVTETGGCSASLIPSELLLGSLKTLHRLRPHGDHIVLSHYSNSLTVSSYNYTV